MSTAPVDCAFATALPKIELHAHLTGSISRACLHDIWVQKTARGDSLQLEDPLDAIPSHKVDYDIKTYGLHSLTFPSANLSFDTSPLVSCTKFSDPVMKLPATPIGLLRHAHCSSSTSLTNTNLRFFPLFSSYIYKLCNDLASVEYSTERVLQDFQSDGVVYLELRTTPRSTPDQSASKDQYVNTVLGVLRKHNDRLSSTMQAFLILSIDRRNTPAEAKEVVDLAIKYQKSGVVGIDLCGNPAVGDVRIFSKAFSRAKTAGLKITLHFAEIAESATDLELQTLLSWQPDRLGHVIHVKDEFQKTIQRQDIAVELCLSCNVHAKMITGTYPDHHFGMWRHTAVPVILCTDDVGVFCSPLSQEYYLAAQHFGLNREQIRSMCERAIDAIFAGPEQQSRLRKIYSEWDVCSS
ncbi:hypothetical protein B0J11DRAFT_445987 [Dendryphion nanum]|uniref:Adenosine deaminase domain-containing protein n=1 Tax=Dendryphion nanum TaxID=256645 RepID=A0A9P9D6Z2_9PLEO|nr:hypothetical protein B0J11DRAFT_445987 [Dendryphion nanum]